MTMRPFVRTVSAACAGLALAVGGVLVAASPATADTAGCVTKSEFRKVHQGMTMTRVHRILDTKGKQSYTYWILGDHYSGREYKACRNPKWSLVSVDYENGKVSGKFAYWG